MDRLYADGKIDAQEYLTLALAAGRTEAEARDALHAAHAANPPAGGEDPREGVLEPHLPEYAAPKRSARRVKKGGMALTGHPLDEVT